MKKNILNAIIIGSSMTGISVISYIIGKKQGIKKTNAKLPILGELNVVVNENDVTELLLKIDNKDILNSVSEKKYVTFKVNVIEDQSISIDKNSA